MTQKTRSPIYVESLIDAPMEAVWAATQEPDQHQRWDVRFGEISYQPHVEGEPQRFTYATNLLPGFTVAGSGESLGDRDRPDGSCWSGLKFWADDWRSIIEAGAGYWRYIPTDGGVRFLTRYDYRPRWGTFGEITDRLLVRPVFGWATAWSFDRLRLWLEKGIPPEHSRNQAIAHAAAIAGLSGVWIYQGVVPKLLAVDAAEVRLWRSALGLGQGPARAAVRAAGAAEVAAGILTIRKSREKGPFVATAIAMPLLALSAAKADRRSFSRAFNPASLNLAMAALAIVAVATADDLPSGRRPLRASPDHQPAVGALP